jgi:PAS domain S-box-containing protein
MVMELAETAGKVLPVAAAAAGGAALALRIGRRRFQQARAFFVRVNGALVHVEVMATALGPNGGKSLADAIRRLEESQKRSVARASAVIYATGQAVWEADSAGHFLEVNRAFEQLTGAGSDDVAGRQWISLLHPDCRDRVVREWFHAVADRRRFSAEAVLEVDGGSRRVELQAEPMRTSDGEVIGWFGRVYAR